MTYLRNVNIAFQDTGSLDAFGRLKVAEPQTLFDAQFTYDLQPLVFEAVNTDGATKIIAHDSTNRRARIEFDGVAAGQDMFLQTYEHFRYQPGKGHEINITFNLIESDTTTIKYAGYGDANNGFFFELLDDGTKQFTIKSDTSVGDQVATQDNWLIDKLDGTGKSGYTLDITKEQILYIDFQALYVGRVRFGFVIDGKLILAHEFDHANEFAAPYIQTANLPIRVGMRTVALGAITTMYFNCSMVASSGGIDEAVGYEFSTPDVNVTAGNGTRTHVVSLRPRTTFNSITNRVKLAVVEIEILVTGNTAVYWEMLIGATFSAAPTYANVNATYSAMEYGTGGALSGASIVVNSGYVSATASTKGNIARRVTERFPITLDSAGSQRALGTLTLVLTGLGGNSASRAIVNFKEIR